MKFAWRISNHAELSGYGGEKTSGRWHTAARGKRIVYMSEHPAVALIEVLVNLKANPRLLPDFYQLLKVNIEESISFSVIAPELLSEHWAENLTETRALGDAWLASGASALLVVPSAPTPESYNYLLNPLHADAKALTVVWRKQIAYDKRLFSART